MTNTPTLGLTQYAGTDTMNPLTQYNADMDKIDDYAGATNTNIGTLASLTTINKESLVLAVNETNASITSLNTSRTNLGSTTQVRALGVSVPNGSKICELTVPNNGTYLVNIYNADGGAVWLGLNGKIIADQASDYYAKVNSVGGASLVFNLTAGDTLSLWNGGAIVTYSVATRIQLVRLK